MKKFILVLIAFPIVLSGQNASIQDCLGAIPICDQVYVESRSPVGFGNINDLNGNINCSPSEQNSIWYVFTVNKSGKFGFLLTPNDPSDDYDWSLFNLTNASCEDIKTDMSILVSCNAAGADNCVGATGATGDTEHDLQGSNCNNPIPTLFAGSTPFNDLIDVEEGNTYVLFINNFSGSTSGYTLDFGLSGDIGIFDETDPFLENATLSDACNGSEIVVQFSEFIQCASLSADNFQLDGPGGPFALTLSSVNCDAGGDYGKEFFLNVTPPLSDGNYTLSLAVNGFTEAVDLCENPSAPIALQLAGPSLTPTIDLGNDTTLCDGASLTLDAGQLAGTYAWSNGSTTSTLEVSTAGSYSVEVNTGCGIATDVIEVSFSSTIDLELGPDTTLCPGATITLDATSPGATYLWNDGSTNPTLAVSQAGTYSITVTSDCGTAEDAINVSAIDPIAATLEDAALCPGDSFSWDVTNPSATYLWQDGSTSPTFTADAAGTYAVTITNNCESLELSAEVQIGGNLPPVNLGSDTTLCAGASLTLSPNSPGTQFLWQDGSSGPTYTVTQPGTYAVTVSNSCDQQEAAITVTYGEPLTAAVADASLCPGESITWDVTNPNATYLWQDGSTAPTFTANTAGTYGVTITNNCESLELSAEVQIGGSLPPVNLGSDTTLCAGASLTLSPNSPGTQFLWQDGSSGPTYTVTQPGTYAVTVSNSCDQQEGAITVTYVEPLTAAVADASLCPGESITWDVTNPNATYLWQDGSTAPTFIANTAGTYAVTITNNCESLELSAEVQTGGSLPPVNLGSDTTLCSGASLAFDLSTPGANFLWQDGSTEPTYTITQPGTYAVTVSNSCDQQEGVINVSYSEPITATLEDTTLCPGESLTWDVSTPGATYLWQDNSILPTFTPTSSGTYAVTITNNCETVELRAEVQVGEALPAIDLGNDTTLCAGESLAFNFDLIDVSFLWHDGSTTSSYQITQSGAYSLTVSNTCDTLSDQINVQIPAPLLLDLGPDTILCNGQSILLDAFDDNAEYFRWQDNSAEPTYRVTQAGEYSVVIGNTCEEISDAIRITECESCNIFVPNSFSPNNDGINDRFKPFANCVFLNFNMMVFDRWGTLLYESTDSEAGWDGNYRGESAANGVYIWVMTLTVEENNRMKALKLSGDVTISK